MTDWEPLPDLNRTFWPQKIERVGEHWLLIFLGVEYGGMYLADDGDVYLVVMDSSFNTVDSAKLSNNTPGALGSARPHFARSGSKLMAVWDKAILPYAVKVQLNAERLGIEDEDTGWDWSDDGGGGGGDEEGDSSDPCVSTDGDGDGDGDGDADGGTSPDNTTGEDESAGGHTRVGLNGTEDTAIAQTDGECDKDGCGCATTSARPLPWLVLAGLGLLIRRRL